MYRDNRRRRGRDAVPCAGGPAAPTIDLAGDFGISSSTTKRQKTTCVTSPGLRQSVKYPTRTSKRSIATRSPPRSPSIYWTSPGLGLLDTEWLEQRVLRERGSGDWLDRLFVAPLGLWLVRDNWKRVKVLLGEERTARAFATAATRVRVGALLCQGSPPLQMAVRRRGRGGTAVARGLRQSICVGSPMK